jgi:hypothetical protein
VPVGPDWIHEIKHDGYRLQVRREGDAVRLFTRRGYDWTKRYPAIASAAAELNAGSDRSSFASQSETSLKPLQFDRQNASPPDDAALGGTRVVLTTEVDEVRFDNVLAAPDPCASAIDAGQ